MSSLFINQFKEIPKFGLLSFVDNTNKSFYLIFSSTLPSTFCTQLLKLQDNIHDNKELQNAYNAGTLEYEVIRKYKKDPGSIELRSQYERLVLEYKDTEYKNMREGYKALGYKLKKYVLTDFRNLGTSGGPLVYVCGKSGSSDIVLGIFESIPEAEKWIQTTYGSNTTDLIPTYSRNPLTTMYHNRFGLKLCA